MATTVIEDAYGHRNPGGQAGTALAAGAVSTTAVGTIAPTTAAGATPTVTAVVANDTRGSFTLNPVTGGGAQATGNVVVVTFAQPYGVAPSAVNCNLFNQAGNVALAVAATGITVAGFSIAVGTVLTTANNYTVSYVVTP
jgi:hypothetical protein